MLVAEQFSFGELMPLGDLGWDNKALFAAAQAHLRQGKQGAPIDRVIDQVIATHVAQPSAHHPHPTKAVPAAVPAGASTTPPSGEQIKDSEVKAVTEQLVTLVDERMAAIEKRFADWKKAQVEAELKLREEREKRDQETATSKAEADSLKKDLAAAMEKSSIAQKKREVEIAAENAATQVATGKISVDKGKKEIAKAITGDGIEPYLPYIIGGVVILASVLLWVTIRKK